MRGRGVEFMEGLKAHPENQTPVDVGIEMRTPSRKKVKIELSAEFAAEFN